MAQRSSDVAVTQTPPVLDRATDTGEKGRQPLPRPVVGRDHALNHGPQALPPGREDLSPLGCGVWRLWGREGPSPPQSLGERRLPCVPCVP